MEKQPAPPRIIPEENEFLVQYMAALRKGFSHVEFLSTGVDDRMQALTSPPSNYLYVVPNFTEEYIDAQSDPTTWKDLIALGTLLNDPQYRRLFIKGDPGIGKTTLTNRITYVLSDPERRAFRERLGYPVPLLAVLREEAFRTVTNWEEFLQAIFKQPLLKSLSVDWHTLTALFEAGQVFLMLDGLDEVTDREQRRNLSAIIQNGLEQYPDGYWWCTTRVVGFEQINFWSDRQSFRLSTIQEFEKHVGTGKKIHVYNGSADDLMMELEGVTMKEYEALQHKDKFKELYLAPFDPAQVRQFLVLWFDLYEPVTHLREDRIQKFLSSLEGHDNIRHLSRIPNLLTMMALYHKVNQDFPDGRYELYDKIIEAYLKIILKQRGLQLHGLQYDELRPCLAELAYEMQKIREGDGTKDSLLTITREKAEAIFSQKLATIARRDTPEQRTQRIREFFDSLEVRSDILLPRGENAYGFLHLSLQEFLAAERLLHQFSVVTNRRNGSDTAEAGFWKEMQGYAVKTPWLETIVLFFEGFRATTQYTPEDCVYAFEKLFDWNKKSGRVNRELAACMVMTDEYIGQMFTDEERWGVLDWMYFATVADDKYLPESNYLLNWAETKNNKWSIESDSVTFPKHPDQIRWLSIKGEMKDYEFLSKFTNLTLFKVEGLFNFNLIYISSLKKVKNIIFSETKDLENFEIIERLTNLFRLSLNGTGVGDLSPLQNLTNLFGLYLNDTKVSNLGPLQNLTNLFRLSLSNTRVSDLSPLRNLLNLFWLELNNTGVSDLNPLQNLSNLSGLYLNSTGVSDLNPLQNLTNLFGLSLDSTRVSDLSPLQCLTNLSWLSLNNTGVSNLGPLQSLTSLSSLELNHTLVNDLSPLQGLASLSNIELNGTLVSDLSPLKGLTNLSSLELRSTQVSDLSQLKRLNSLSRIELNSTQVSDLSPLQLLCNLSWLSLADTQVSDLSPLQNLPHLSGLSLNNTEVSDLSPLRNLVSLYSLYFNNTPVSDLSPLLNLVNLSWLYLNSTQVGDLSSLRNLSNLSWLDINNTQVSDLGPLEKLTNLFWLQLNNTQVSDLSPLKGLNNLSVISLADTQVSDLSPIKSLINLSLLEIKNTPAASNTKQLDQLKKANPNLTIITK